MKEDSGVGVKKRARLGNMTQFIAPLTAGLIAVLVGFTSTAALVYQAATANGATPLEAGSWLSALCLGSGLLSIFYSLRYRTPVLGAWSTPGAALLAVGSGYALPFLIGAFILNGVLITIAGATGWFEKVLTRIPITLASAMLAGILMKFGLEVFLSMKVRPELVVGICVAYLVAKRVIPRYAILITLFVGVLTAGALGLLELHQISLEAPNFIFTRPEFSIGSILSIALPLFVVTMASQNLPGVIAMRAAGYQPHISQVMTGSGVLTTLLAPFGAFGINLAAITAAICLGKEAHEDKSKRYLASVFAGIIYIIFALLGGTIGVILSSLPKELILSVAGLALFSAIANSLAMAMSVEKEREPALITFLVTASGVAFFGVGSAFWGIVAGVTALITLTWARRSESI